MKIYHGQELIDEFRKRSSDYLSEVINEVKKSGSKISDFSEIKLRKRDFVDEVNKYYVNDDSSTILVISGLKATGKTFGALQAVEQFLNNTLYITADKNEKETADDYIAELDKAAEKYIIIDEYSWIKDRTKLDQSLYSYVNQPNPNERKRIIITGTDSIVLDGLNAGDLIHRTLYKNVNLFTYQEFCHLYYKEFSEKSCLEYIEKGGVFIKHAIKDFVTMRNYIQTAVIENLANSIHIDEKTARAIVYEIIYEAVCPHDEDKVRIPDKNNISHQNILRAIDIDPNMRFSASDLQIVGDLLVKTGLVVKTYNFADLLNGKQEDECRFRYNLTNPSINYQMLKNFFNEVSANQRLGTVFEASVVSYMYYNVIDQDELYYIDLHDKKELGNPELEIVIVNRHEQLVYLMDAKKETTDTVKYNQSIVSQSLENYFGCYSVAGRYIICNIPKEIADVRHGKEIIFTNIESETLKIYDHFEDNFKLIKQMKNNRNINRNQGLGEGHEEHLLPYE